MFGSKKKNEGRAAADRLAALRKKVAPAATAGTEAARTYAPVAKDKASEVAARAREKAAPKVEAAKEWARPRVDQAVEVAGPKVQHAVDNLAPRVDATRDHIVDDWLPKLSAAIATVVAASTAAKEQAGAVADRAPDALAVMKGDAVAKAAPKRGRKGSVLIVLGLLAAAAAAVTAVMRRQTPREDPWATPSSDSYASSSAGRDTNLPKVKDRAAGLAGIAKEKATAVASVAKEKTSAVGGVAKEKATEVAGVAKEKKSQVTGAAKERVGAAKRAGTKGSDVGPSAGGAASGSLGTGATDAGPGVDHLGGETMGMTDTVAADDAAEASGLGDMGDTTVLTTPDPTVELDGTQASIPSEEEIRDRLS